MKITIDTLKGRWQQGSITAPMLVIYVRKGIITPEQYKEITALEYPNVK